MIIITNSRSISRSYGQLHGGCPEGSDIRRLGVRSLFVFLFAGVILASAASASTPGCPDCPDWNNFNAWWDRYHKAPNQGDFGSSSGSLRDQAEKSRAKTENSEISKVEYPNSEIVFRPDGGLDGCILLDARSPADYEKGHLPGARNLYWRWLRPAGTLDIDVAVPLLSSLGIEETDSIVVYGVGDDSAYLFWALEVLGHPNLARLEGDFRALNGLDLVQNAPEAEESEYTPAFRKGLLVDETMLKEGHGSPGVQIVDARPSYPDRAASRISNSMYFKTADLYSDPEAGTLKAARELERLFTGRGIDEEKVQMIYGTPEATALYFALRTMGYRATVVDGDWWQKTDYMVSSIS